MRSRTTSARAASHALVRADAGALLPAQFARALAVFAGDDEAEQYHFLLARARGVVQFSDPGSSLVGVQGRALGGELRLEGGMVAPPASGAAEYAVPSIRLT